MAGRSARVLTARLLAIVVGAGAVHAGAAPARGEEPQVAALLRGYRCMMLTDGAPRGRAGPPPVLSAPRTDGRRLGTASEPVVAVHPLRVSNGYARVLHADGSPGWVRRDRLMAWAVAASPGLRCLPAMMTDGRTGVTYAHPG